jgi:hypothetical protein
MLNKNGTQTISNENQVAVPDDNIGRLQLERGPAITQKTAAKESW